MKSIFLRNEIMNHFFSSSTLQKPTKYFLNVYPTDPGLNPTWSLPAPIFAPYEITSFSVVDNTMRISEQVQLGPVLVGQTTTISHFVFFAQYGNDSLPVYKPLFIGQFRTTRTVPEGDYLLFSANSIVFTEV